jgi:hypothetical protein
VIEKGFTNCTQCEEYGCSKLVERWVTREEIQSKSPHPIPAVDYALFIQPYENKEGQAGCTQVHAFERMLTLLKFEILLTRRIFLPG